MYNFNDGLDFARQMDFNDELKNFKERFYIRKDVLYMDGNSLGLCSKDAEKYVYKALEDWKTYGIDIWTDENANYFLYQDKLGSMMAPLINADAEEVTLCASTTINIHQAIATFYHPTASRNKIIMDDINFPTDKYAVYSQIKLHGYNPDECLKVVKSRDGNFIYEDDVIEAMTDDVCLVLLPSALYRSSQLPDMKKLTKAAHEKGIYIGFDLCHSIGSVPHDFKDIDCDFAVWCTYKYLNGGPGSIAGLYINKKHFDMEPGLAGWQGNNKETQFDLNQEFEHARYAGGWQTGTQSILSMAPIEGSLKLFEEAGINNVRKKSLTLTAYLMYLIDTKLKKYGFSYSNPTIDERRGGHVALEHDDAIRITKAMKENKIVPDFRFPNIIRLAPIALYTSFEDVYEMVERIMKIMDNKEYENFDSNRGIVA
ncbi:kynureninase [Sedimentibacter hydroxybenzoicus DSM 7310]|uniref:Kynureninase n=1 Tax=Sedimentibacter hydroxybenzoicus DSM 7310 TaxID=1123245 RepID=A0A974GV06_SEDHY|nr:kynureninase [Sedimentibacter hydroxybenzoicus]NYB72878.1 kynureninase [Sedimentibacter hydroxybenzoicus DSM 7310]